MFPLVPYKHISIHTALSVEKSGALVSGKVADPQTPIDRLPAGKEYKGTVSLEGFQIQKIVRDRWASRPMLYGRFSPTARGTMLNVHVTLQPVEIVFWAVWCFPLLAVTLISLGNFATMGRDAFFLIPLGMLAFGYLFVFFTFGPQANEAEQFLKSIFAEHEIIEQTRR